MDKQFMKNKLVKEHIQKGTHLLTPYGFFLTLFLLFFFGFHDSLKAGNLAPAATVLTSSLRNEIGLPDPLRLNDKNEATFLISPNNGGFGDPNFMNLTFGREFVISQLRILYRPDTANEKMGRIKGVKVSWSGGSKAAGNITLEPANGGGHDGTYVYNFSAPNELFLKTLKVEPLSFYNAAGDVSAWNNLADKLDPLRTNYQISEIELSGTIFLRYRVQRAMNFLGRDASNWTNQHNCNGCHVQAQAIVGLSEGFKNNYDVGQLTYASATTAVGHLGAKGANDLEWLSDYNLKSQHSDGGLGHVSNPGSHGLTYILTTSHFAAFGAISFDQHYVHGPGGVPAFTSEVHTFLKKMAGWAAPLQASSGYWTTDHGTFVNNDQNSRVTAAFGSLLYYVATHLAADITAGEKTNYLAKAQNAKNYLLTTPFAANTQARAYAIIGVVGMGGGSVAQMNGLVAKLIDIRRDGEASWGMTGPADADDPFTSGEALYALTKAGFDASSSISKPNESQNPPAYTMGEAWQNLLDMQDTEAEIDNGYWKSRFSTTNFVGSMLAATALGAGTGNTELKWLSIPEPPNNELLLNANSLLQVSAISNTGEDVKKVEFWVKKVYPDGTPDAFALIGTSYHPSYAPGAPAPPNTMANAYDGSLNTFEIQVSSLSGTGVFDLMGKLVPGTFEFVAKAYSVGPGGNEIVDEQSRTALVGIQKIILPDDFYSVSKSRAMSTWISNPPANQLSQFSFEEESNTSWLAVKSTDPVTQKTVSEYEYVIWWDVAGNPGQFTKYDPANGKDNFFTVGANPVNMNWTYKDGGHYFVRFGYRYKEEGNGVFTAWSYIPNATGHKIFVKQKPLPNVAKFTKGGMVSDTIKSSAGALTLMEDDGGIPQMDMEIHVQNFSYAERPGHSGANQDIGDADSISSAYDVYEGVRLLDQKMGTSQKIVNSKPLGDLDNFDTPFRVHWKLYRSDRSNVWTNTPNALPVSEKLYERSYNLKMSDFRNAAGLGVNSTLLTLLKKQNLTLTASNILSNRLKIQEFWSANNLESWPGVGSLKTPMDWGGTASNWDSSSSKWDGYLVEVTIDVQEDTWGLNSDNTQYLLNSGGAPVTKTMAYLTPPNPNTSSLGGPLYFRAKQFVKDQTQFQLSRTSLELPNAYTGDPYPVYNLLWNWHDNNPYGELKTNSKVVLRKTPTAFGVVPPTVNYVRNDWTIVNSTTKKDDINAIKNGDDQMVDFNYQQDLNFFGDNGGRVPDWGMSIPGPLGFDLDATVLDYTETVLTPVAEDLILKDNDTPAIEISLTNMRGQKYWFEVNKTGPSGDPVRDPVSNGMTHAPFFVKGTYAESGGAAVDKIGGMSLVYNGATAAYNSGTGLTPLGSSSNSRTENVHLKGSAVGANPAPLVIFKEDERNHLEITLYDNDQIASNGLSVSITKEDGTTLNTAQFTDNRPLDGATQNTNPILAMANGERKHIERRSAYIVFPDPFSLGSLVVTATDRKGNQSVFTIPFQVVNTSLDIRVLESKRQSITR